MKSTFKRILSFALAGSLIGSPAHSQIEELHPAAQEFITEYSKQTYLYDFSRVSYEYYKNVTEGIFANAITSAGELNSVESKSAFEEVFSQKGTEALYVEQIRYIKALENRDAIPDEQMNKILERDEAIARHAAVVVDRIFKQADVDKANRDILRIVNEFPRKPEARVAVGYLIDAMNQYYFPEEQLRAMELKNYVKADASRGAKWGLGISAALAAAVAIFRPSKAKNVVDDGARAAARSGVVDNAVERAAKNLTPKASSADTAIAAATKAGEDALDAAAKAKLAKLEAGIKDVSEIKREIVLTERYVGKLGPTSAQAAEIIAKEAPPVAASRRLFREKVRDFIHSGGIKRSLRNALYVVGVPVAATTGVSVGLGVYQRSRYKETFDTTPIDAAKLRRNYFDGLAVLGLKNETADLLNRSQVLETQKVEPQYIRDLMLRWTQLYSEKSLMQKFAPDYLILNYLPPEITLNPKTGVVTFDLRIYDKTLPPSTFTYPHLVQPDATTDKVRVPISLQEINQTLIQVFANVRNYEIRLENEAREKREAEEAANAATQNGESMTSRPQAADILFQVEDDYEDREQDPYIGTYKALSEAEREFNEGLDDYAEGEDDRDEAYESDANSNRSNRHYHQPEGYKGLNQ